MFVDQFKAQARYDLCKQCEFFKSTLAQCSKCGCFMKVKVKLSGTSCPVGKWLAQRNKSKDQFENAHVEVD